jgi:hypothetical protein
MGSGTADDPLLIQSVDDLVDLARPEVGQRGYHFRQTVDLNISIIGTWPAIIFNGYYDGQDHIISNVDPAVLVSALTARTVYERWVFGKVKAGHIKRLKMRECGLADSIENQSELLGCNTSAALVKSARNSYIFSCEADDNLVKEIAVSCGMISCMAGKSLANAVEDCQIQSCQSGSALISDTADRTKITDCLVVIRAEGMSAGVVLKITNSAVERCFVTGKLYHASFSGVTYLASNSTINRCAVGRFEFNGRNSSWYGRIARGNDNSDFKNNVAIDSIPTSVNIDGESIASARFNQRYFEHTLDWDFEKTWIWDNKNDHPALRQVGIGATPAAMSTATKAPAASEKNPSVDLLTHQVKANMWL